MDQSTQIIGEESKLETGTTATENHSTQTDRDDSKVQPDLPQDDYFYGALEQNLRNITESCCNILCFVDDLAIRRLLKYIEHKKWEDDTTPKEDQSTQTDCDESKVQTDTALQE